MRSRSLEMVLDWFLKSFGLGFGCSCDGFYGSIVFYVFLWVWHVFYGFQGAIVLKVL